MESSNDSNASQGQSNGGSHNEVPNLLSSELRSVSSALYFHLRQHPDIFMAYDGEGVDDFGPIERRPGHDRSKRRGLTQGGPVVVTVPAGETHQFIHDDRLLCHGRTLLAGRQLLGDGFAFTHR